MTYKASNNSSKNKYKENTSGHFLTETHVKFNFLGI